MNTLFKVVVKVFQALIMFGYAHYTLIFAMSGFATVSEKLVVSIFRAVNNNFTKKEGKAISVRGHGGPWGCETLNLPYFLDSQLTDGSKVVSLMCQPPFTLRKIPGTHFC
jgi:hypothetical protein